MRVARIFPCHVRRLSEAVESVDGLGGPSYVVFLRHSLKPIVRKRRAGKGGVAENNARQVPSGVRDLLASHAVAQ